MSKKVFNEHGVQLSNGAYVFCKQVSKGYEYVFRDINFKEYFNTVSVAPKSITPRYAVGKEITVCLKQSVSEGLLDEDKVGLAFKQVLSDLKDFSDKYAEIQEEADQREKQAQREAEAEAIEEAMNWFGNFDQPVLWLGSCIDWLTAGERANILRTFFAFCSQIILKYPISVIGLGEGSSGKDHVQEVARSLCPQEYFCDEKKPTLASMFHRSEQDPYYYDGQIVCYGDMGGENDQDEARQTKDILKELQSDGFVNRPISLKQGDGFITADIQLRGKPALSFQTVPNYNADDQELSRSMTITPRTDNRKGFFEMKHILEFVGSPIQIKQSKFREGLEKYMPDVIRGLRKMFNDIEIINPYTRNLEDFIGDTKYFKRDFDKYNSLLKVISIFNYSSKKIIEVNDMKFMFVDKYDLVLFFTLFEVLQDSISRNLSPKASEILTDFQNNYDDYVEECLTNHDDEGITVNEYLEIGEVSISKRSMQKYFKELNLAGYIRNIGVYGRSPIYKFLEKDVETRKWSLDLFDMSVKQLCFAYGEKLCNEIQESHLTPADDVSIFNQHPLVDAPYWSEFT